MTKEELLSELRDKLQISIDTSFASLGKSKNLVITIIYDGEDICSDFISTDEIISP